MMSSDYSAQEQLNFFVVSKFSEVETPTGWKYANEIKVNDKLKVELDGKSNAILVKKIVAPIDCNQIIYYY